MADEKVTVEDTGDTMDALMRAIRAEETKARIEKLDNDYEFNTRTHPKDEDWKYALKKIIHAG